MKKGFTLIELLATVMIIGILAAIALPQYTRTIEKARASEAFVLLKTLADAQTRYLQANPTEIGICKKAHVLAADVDMKGGTWDTSHECDWFVTKHFVYTLRDANGKIVAYRTNDPANPFNSLYKIGISVDGTRDCRWEAEEGKPICAMLEHM